MRLFILSSAALFLCYACHGDLYDTEAPTRDDQPGHGSGSDSSNPEADDDSGDPGSPEPAPDDSGDPGGSDDSGGSGGADDPPTRPVDPDPSDDDDPPDDPIPLLTPPGSACSCDSDCQGFTGNPGLCIHGVCGTRASSDSCSPGSAAECPSGQRCWSGTGRGVCYPDYLPGQCVGRADDDGSCVSDGSRGCYSSCGTMCELPGEPPGDGGGEHDPGHGGDEGGGSDDGSGGDAGDGLGPCSGSPAECEAARVINEYRASHVHAGECNHALRWNDTLGRMAHDHQSGPFVRHSSYGYIENVGQAYGVGETASYIIQFEPGSEPHCNPDGSYTMSHHCAAMFCGNFTVGVGVFEDGDTTYMTMIFGDASGNPSW